MHSTPPASRPIFLLAALLAIATDGSSFRRNYREDPELAAEMAKLQDENILQRIVRYEACRMAYDLERIAPK